MRDNTALVGLARLWGDYEGRILLSESINTSVMKGYDDMDLARLLESWAEEYYWDDVEFTDLEEFFHAKLKELCKAIAYDIRDACTEDANESHANCLGTPHSSEEVCGAFHQTVCLEG